MRKIISAAFFLLCVLFFGICEETESGFGVIRLNIEDAVKTALENNISIKSSALELEKLSAVKKYSWGSVSPSISASGIYRNNFEENADSLSFSGTVSLGLSTNLYTTMKAARLNYENGLLSYEETLRSVELSVRKTFYALLYKKENIELQKRGLETNRVQYQTNQEKFRNGKISELDVMTSRVTYEQKKPIVESAEISYKNDLALFKQILGMEQNTEVELDGTLDDVLELKEIKLDSLPKVSEPAPKVRTAEKSLEIAKNSLLSSRFSAYGPSLSASYTYGITNAYSVTKNEKSWNNPEHSLSVGVNIPLDGYLPWSQGGLAVRSSKKSVEDAKLNLESARTSVQVEAENYLRKINQGLGQIFSLKENEKLAEQAHNMSLTAYNYGKTDILSLQNYSDSLLSARVSVKQQAYSILSSLLDFENLLGLPFGSSIK